MRGLRSIWVVLLFVCWFGGVTAVSAATHDIQQGETLTGIAAEYNVSIDIIMQANPQITDRDLIFAGDTLTIPEGAGGFVPDGIYYLVQQGDWLSKIAREKNTTVERLLELNPAITNPDLIYPGQSILISPIGRGPALEALPQPPVTTAFGVGVEIYDFDNIVTVLDMEADWVKMEFRWTPGDSPGLVAGDIKKAHDYGLKILVTLVGKDEHPEPGSLDFDRYVDFVEGVAELGPDAIEIWNEMNLEKEWPVGEISPEQYVEYMLKPAYTKIKGIDHDIVVVAGGLAPTGYYPTAAVMDDSVYLEDLFENKAALYMDCIGVHYKAGATSPHVNVGHPAQHDHHSWYFKRTMDTYRDAFNGLRPLCITEIGYLSPEGIGGLPGEFFWADDTALTEQGFWLGEAIELAREQYNVDMLIVYNLDATAMENTEPEAAYAIIRQDGTCPACNPIKNAIIP